MPARDAEGNDPEYLEALKRWQGADAAQPHRIAYEKLART